ncbi:hypothetical protein T4A_3411 [Trichinella pseudospiralis]|uniref:Uncharacterized protein n=1 Tax=Trichinella pseudospiralis TaxID=6337 RepID=A0A0V1DSG3_TRIPS|nr:hypothetical protein T4A_3411 [Trichinella pseudospiralis]
MSMMIYGKASRLLCRHLLYQASTKSFLNNRRLNPASYAFAVQRKYTTINGTYQPQATPQA